MGGDVGGAVVSKGVVPLRVVVHAVGSSQVIQKYAPRLLGRGPCVIEIDFFSAAIVGPEADHVPLVAKGIDQFVVAKETADRRVAFSHLLPRLDRHGDIALVAKVEAHNGMRDPGRAPIGDEYV